MFISASFKWWVNNGFTVVTKLINHFESFMVLGDAISTLEFTYVYMDLQPCFKVHNLVSVYPKNKQLSQMTALNATIHVMVSDYRLVKI